MKMNEVIQKIIAVASRIRDSIKSKRLPTVSMPVRSLQNVKYDDEIGFFELNGKMKERTLTASTIKTFAQTLRMMSFSKELIETDDMATKREMYYTAYNWEEARFNSQPESDSVMDDIEAMMMTNREKMGFIAGEKGGGLVAGELIVVDRDFETKEWIRIDCTKFGSGAYSIPAIVDHFGFETKAKYILAIETAGAFERLNKHKYWKKTNCIIVGMGGVPTRSTRRFIRKLSDDYHLPVYVFTDGDPYGYFNIYRTLKVGSGNAAHINEFFCVPNAKFIGVTPQDIIDYKLPTHSLKEVDIKRAKDAVKNDPFVKEHKEWQEAIKLMVKLGKRVEQQAFAKYGLNYVMDTYLPEKLSAKKKWLP